MTRVGVRDLRNGLSRYLRLAAGGETIVVCDHGRPLAVLAPVPADPELPRTATEHLAALAAQGLVALGRPGWKRRRRRRPIAAELSSAVHEDRQERDDRGPRA
ncbi:MAG: type II toxin-antitoxin system prevent-host-death family antitoxin [Planctomycetes bacterium]|nr:type II toxin-antitoxin system prevent-host-death family antitoxin [Planctomycetota bacterium]